MITNSVETAHRCFLINAFVITYIMSVEYNANKRTSIMSDIKSVFEALYVWFSEFQLTFFLIDGMMS